MFFQIFFADCKDTGNLFFNPNFCGFYFTTICEEQLSFPLKILTSKSGCKDKQAIDAQQINFATSIIKKCKSTACISSSRTYFKKRTQRYGAMLIASKSFGKILAKNPWKTSPVQENNFPDTSPISERGHVVALISRTFPVL